MNTRLKRFMFLSYALHLMEVEIDIDEVGLTIEHFQKIDVLLANYLDPEEADDMKEELVQLVKELTEDDQN